MDVTIPATVPLGVTCVCGRRVPLYAVRDGGAVLKRLLKEFQSDVALLSWKCRDCKRLVLIYSRDLYWATGA